MTAQIIAMNLNGAAIASDTMVSAGFGDEFRSFGSQQKIYPLIGAENRYGSPDFALAAVVFGGATLMDIPWSVLFAHARDWLRSYDDENLVSVREAGDWFFDEVLPDFQNLLDAEKEHARSSVRRTASELVRLMEDRHSAPNTADAGDAAFFSELARSCFDDLVGPDEREEVSALADYYADPEMKEAIDEAFRYRGFPLANEDNLTIVNRIVAYRSRSGISAMPSSGIAFVGIGRGEVHPSIATYRVSAFAKGQVEYETDELSTFQIGSSRRSALVPLAAADGAVQLFFQGIDDEVRTFIHSSIHSLGLNLGGLASSVLRSKGIDDKEVDSFLRSAFESAATETWGVIDRKVRSDARPLLDSISVMPKAELAMLTRSLISIPVLWGKLRPMGSVGGPVEIAVISKDEGFRWVERTPAERVS